MTLEMLATKRQARKRAESSYNVGPDSEVAGEDDGHRKKGRESDHDNLAIYPLAIALLAGPSTIMSVIVIAAGFTYSIGGIFTGYTTLIAVIIATDIILYAAVVAKTLIHKRISMVF